MTSKRIKRTVTFTLDDEAIALLQKMALKLAEGNRSLYIRQLIRTDAAKCACAQQSTEGQS